MVIENNRRRAGKRAAILCAVFMLIFMQFPLYGLARTAHADGGLQISAAYPDQKVTSGGDYTFYLKVKNDSGTAQTVDFSATVPNGWTYIIQGGGSQVTKAYVENSSSIDVNLTVTVPQDTATGQYPVKFTGKGESGGEDTTALNLDVTQEGTKKGNWKAAIASKDGSNTTAFTYATTITNNSGIAQTYGLSTNAPEGWTVTFSAQDASQKIASCGVSPEGNETVDVSITPVYNTKPGKYTVTCTATSPSETLTLDLNLNVTGSYNMVLTTPNGKLNADAYAERDTPVVLEIQNTGSSDLNNIKLSSSYTPSGWTIKFDQDSIKSLAAGEKKDVTAYIKASSNSVVGDYLVNFNASSSQVSADGALRVAFKASVAWGYFGLIIILLLIAGLIGVFMKFGRR